MRARISKEKQDRVEKGKGTITKTRNRCDRLWKSIGKESAVCEICSNIPTEKVVYKQLHPHHIIGRNNLQFRWDLRNRCWLCAYHHKLGTRSAHNDPMWFHKEYFIKYRKDDYRYLNSSRDHDFKLTYKFLVDRLNELS